MRKKLGVSVCICSYNSERTVKKCLSYLSKQKVLRNRKWEVLLVDNGSTDKTNGIAKDFVKGTSLEKVFRIVREGKPGISNALHSRLNRNPLVI